MINSLWNLGDTINRRRTLATPHIIIISKSVKDILLYIGDDWCGCKWCYNPDHRMPLNWWGPKK